MDKTYVIAIADALQISTERVRNTVALLEDGATVPFISRYRKEATGSLTEVQITDIRDMLAKLRELDKRRDTILRTLEEQGNLTETLRQQVLEAGTMTELEDLYLPYKPKKKTRATVARVRGLEPLAKIIMSQRHPDPEGAAAQFVDPTGEVPGVEEALAGARDIIAEWINEDRKARGRLRNLFFREGIIYSKVLKNKEKAGQNFRLYFDWSESVQKVPSHRYLAMTRGEKEGFLRISVMPPEEKALRILVDIFIRARNASAEHVMKALADSYGRLLQPSLETEVRSLLKERSDEYAIGVFAGNVRQLLMAPPLGRRNVLAIDPGFRTGCKVVCLDGQGNLLHNETIYPHPPENEVRQSAKKILSLVESYDIEAIAIGNGTAGRETERFIRSIRFHEDILAVMVNESGASVYSASAVAREEFPDYDVTVRGAVSIGRRLMDPLAELVKIDPKSIGVGQYQHDVNQKELQKSLEDTVVSCVNQVGVEVNTSSKQLLAYVSGVGPALAGNIISYRKENGPFRSKEELRKVPRFGDKAFEQAAGFLRIQGAKNPLDASAVHPESYHVVNKMAEDLHADMQDLINNEELRQKIDLRDYVTAETGIPTLEDIIEELARPGRDPRKKFDLFEFAQGVNSMEDLEPGMELPGIITNITAFGAFVDIGVHQDGLVHISEMTDRFIRDPNEVVQLNQKVKVRVLVIDKDRKRISLSMKGMDES